MVIKILIVLTIVLHVIAAVISLRLTKRTKYNLSWILITLGFLFLLVRRFFESLSFFNVEFNADKHSLLYVWLGIATSTFFAVGLILVSKIFDYMEKMEKEKRESEKKFLSVIIQAEEKERERIAKDIHDGLGPLISTIKMSVSALKKEKVLNESNEILQNLELVINESIKTVKDISDNLSPHVIENFGLVRALQNFIQKINSTKNISINFTCSENFPRLTQNFEIILYRVLCELMNNTMKHAAALNIDIKLHQDLHNVYLDYKDDGQGFEMDSLFKAQTSGTGLYNIFSRVNSLKGTIETDSESGKGVLVKIKIPL
jgi:signal transduction histidine kinase